MPEERLGEEDALERNKWRMTMGKRLLAVGIYTSCALPL